MIARAFAELRRLTHGGPGEPDTPAVHPAGAYRSDKLMKRPAGDGGMGMSAAELVGTRAP